MSTIGVSREVTHWYPSCAQCDWTGEGSPDQRIAFRRAGEHVAQAHEHRAQPRPGSEVYPEGWDPATGDVPDWIVATCATCAESLDWDPRNLWSHSA
jgi:hypothetical protein